MNITELKHDTTDFHVKVTVPAKEISAETEKELGKLAKTAKLDGFRVGKVPASVLQKKYGHALRSDAVKNKIMQAMKDVVKDKNLRILTDPEVDDLKNEEGKSLEFTLKYQLLPEIPMPDFKKISIEKPVLEIKDKQIDEQMEKLVGLAKEYNKESKTKAKKGDQVTIDAVGSVGGKEFAGGKLTSHKLVLGSGAFIPGFEDQLIGAKAGDDVLVKVDFPKEYHEKTLAGKASEFKVKVLAVHSESEAKLNDEFAKKFNFENLAALREQVSKNLSESYAEPIETMMKMSLFDKLEGMMKFEVPKSLLEREANILKGQASQIEDEELSAKSAKEQDAYFNKLASRRVKLGLMLAEYVKIHKLQIEKADMNRAIMAQARHFPGRENEIINLYLKNPNALESLKGPILEDKAVRNIFEKEVKLTEKTYTKEKLEKLLATEDNRDHGHMHHTPARHVNNHPHGHEDHVHGPDCNHEADHTHTHQYEHDHPHNSDHTHEHNRKH
jgi:trigger factor